MSLALWDDPVVTWDDADWTWDGLPAGAGPCPDEPTEVAADPFYALVTAPGWIGDVGVLIEIETYARAFTATISVTDTRSDPGDCPPGGDPNPLTSMDVALPAGVIFTLDGAAESALFFDKAAKRSVGALRRITPSGSRLIWPTVGGPCRSACVAVDAGGVDTDGATIVVSTILRET